MILFNCVHFQNGKLYYRKEFAPRGSEFFPLRARAVPFGMENQFTTLGDLPNMLLFLLRTCVTAVMGATPFVMMLYILITLLFSL